MSKQGLSQRQADFLSKELPRITIVEGCISSGKTFICNHKAIRQLVDHYQGKGLVFFIGKTMDTLERNILSPLEKQYGTSFFTYSKGAKKANLCGIEIDLEGCNDIRAESKIRGTTAEFIYGDELTLGTRSLWCDVWEVCEPLTLSFLVPQTQIPLVTL